MKAAIGVVIVLLLLAGGFVLETFLVYAPQRARLEQQLAKIQVELQKGKKVKELESELDQEIQNVQARLSALRIVLPEDLNVDGYLDQVRKRCEVSGVRIVDQSSQENPKDFLDEAHITLELEGSADAISRVLQPGEPAGRLAYLDRSEREGHSVLEVTIFASPPSKYRTSAADASLCAKSGGWSGLWPHSRSIAELRAAVESNCGELATLAPQMEKVHALELHRVELEELVAVMNQIDSTYSGRERIETFR